MLTPEQLQQFKSGLPNLGTSQNPVDKNQVLDESSFNNWIGSTAEQKKPGLFDFSGKGNTSIHQDIQKRGQNVQADIAGTSPESQGENPLVRGFQAAGQAAGAIGDVGGDLIGGLIPKGVKNVASSAASKLAQAIGFKAEPTPAFTEKYNSWADAHPDAAKNLNSVLKTVFGAGEVAGNVAGSDVGALGTKVGTEKIGQLADKAIEDAKVGIKSSLKRSTEVAGAKSLKNSIEATMPLQDKATRIDQLASGNVTRKGVLGKSLATPTEEDITRGTAAHPYIGGKKDPLDQIAGINSGIKSNSTLVDTLADKHAAPSNFEDIHNYIQDNIRPTEALKKDPKAFESYSRAISNTSDTVATALREEAKNTGDFSNITSSKPIRAARIQIDKDIKEELGKAAFGTPQYYGIKAAEIDARNMLNRLQEDLIRYPGQIENLNRYNEAIRTLNEKGINITPEHEQLLKDQFGLKSTPESESAAEEVANKHDRMSQLFDARDNIINKYQKNVGKNKIQEYISAHPLVRSIANTVTRGATEGAIIKSAIE